MGGPGFGRLLEDGFGGVGHHCRVSGYQECSVHLLFTTPRFLGPSMCSCPMQEAGLMPGKVAGSVPEVGVTLCWVWACARAGVSAKPGFALETLGRNKEESWEG